MLLQLDSGRRSYSASSFSVAAVPILPDEEDGSARIASSVRSSSYTATARQDETSPLSPILSPLFALLTGTSSMVAAWMEALGEWLPVKKDVSMSTPTMRPGNARRMMHQSCPDTPDGALARALAHNDV